MAGAKDRSWQEWVITVGVVALSLLGVWTVFGDDLVQLFQPPGTPSAPSSQSRN